LTYFLGLQVKQMEELQLPLTWNWQRMKVAYL